MFEKCLVVDDHPMISETIKIMLNSLGINDVILAKDGAEAISKTYHHRPSLIITDLQMDPIDGLEMLRIVRSGRYGLPHYIPIIVLTSNAATSIIKECIIFDVDAFIVKPVNKQTLESRIYKLSSQIKPKKKANHYLNLYRIDPLKEVTFINNDNSSINQELSNENKIHSTKNSYQKKKEKLKTKTFKDESKHNFIRWQNKYETGNKKLDNSNKGFLAIINETYNLTKHNKSNYRLYEKLAEEFNDYINEHLPFEEKLLSEKKYPEFNEHKKTHDVIKKKAEDILLRCQAEPKLYKTEFINLLKFWWINHIIKEDAKYKNLFHC